MNRGFKKFIAVVCSLAMVVCSMTVYNNTAVKAVDWSDTSTWTAVTVGGVEYKMTAEIGWVKGFTTHGAATGYMKGDALWCTFADAAYSKVVINGVTYEASSYQDASDTVRFMGAQMWWMPSMCSTQQTTMVFYQNDTVKDTVYVYNPNGVEGGEETTTDPNAPTEPETTTVLQVPGKVVGLVANINDLKTNYTIAFAGISTATSYNLYIDGELYGQIGNGGILTIADAGLVAGQTYKFQVSAVNAAGEGELSDVKEVTIPTVEEETTTEQSGEQPTEPVEEFDPSTITEWTPVTGSTNVSYYIADGKDAQVQVKPQVEGDNIYTAYAIGAPFTSVTFNGVEQDIPVGAFYRIYLNDITEAGYYTVTVVDASKNNTVTIYYKVVAAEETTTPAPYVEGEVLVDEANVTKEVPAYTVGDPWQAEYNNTPVKYVQGKQYVAEVVVSSDVDKTIKLVFQNTGDWSFIDAAGGYEYTIAAGTKVKITYVFEATQGTDNGNFDIYLGSVADAATLVFESKKLTTYSEVPEGVATGVEVLSAPSVTTYEVTVDGAEVAEVEEGTTYTLPTDSTLGYICGDIAYKAGATVTVNEDMAFTSIGDVSVTVENGAGIRYTTTETGGIRFQATVTASDAVLASAAVTEGMLITANDLYTELGGSTLDKNSTYTFIPVENNGTWYDSDKDGTPNVGTYCSSIVNIAESNWIRQFIARAYVTITYADGSTETVYSGMTGARSIAGVAQAIQNAGYPNLDNAAKGMIDIFAAAK